MKLRKLRIMGIGVFAGIAIIVIISLEVDKLLEILFIFHKKALIIMGILFVGAELILFIIKIFKKILKGKIEIVNLSKHLIWGSGFLFLLVIDLAIFKMIVHPKLAKIEILYPTNKAEVRNHKTNVMVSARAVEGKSIYIIVKTPQGTMWTQEKSFTSQFKEELEGQAQLGEEENGIGKVFKIFAIETKEDLEIGVLRKIPTHSLVSNVVIIRRLRKD